MTECVIGPSIGARGYARVHRGKWVYAHRDAWEQAHGPIPEGLELHHVCGTKACVNVEHLELHTRSSHGAQHRRCDHADEERGSQRTGTYCRACKRERRRERYRTDPDFRARALAAQKRYEHPASPPS